MGRRLSRERLKDITLDYTAAFAERHGIPAPAREQSRFEGLRLEPGEPAPHEASRQVKAPAKTVEVSRGVARETGRSKGLALSRRRDRSLQAGAAPGATERYERGPEPPDLAPERGRSRDRDLGMER